MGGELEVRVEPGLPAGICSAAARAVADRRFLSAAWFEAAAEDRVRTLLLTDRDGQPLAALPLAGSGPVRQLPGSYWPFRSFPVAEQLGAAGLGLLIRKAGVDATGLAIRIGPICEDDPAVDLLRSAVSDTPFRLVERVVGRCFVQDVAALTADGPWPHASAVKRNAGRERRLAQQGPLEWRFARGTELDRDLFEAMAAVEAASWQGTEGRDLKLAGAGRVRWERLAADPRVADHFAACLLSVGGRPIAFSFDIDVAATRFGICSGFDPAFGRASPGRLLHYRNTEAAIARGIRLINWGCGDSGYKRQLGATEGPRLLDCLLVRDLPGLVPLARRLWAG